MAPWFGKFSSRPFVAATSCRPSITNESHWLIGRHTCWKSLIIWQNLATLGSCVSRNLEHLQVGSHVLLTNVLGKASEVHVPTFRDWSLQGRSLTQYHKFGQFDQAIPIHILTKPWRSPDSCRDFCKESTRSQDELLFLPQVSST